CIFWQWASSLILRFNPLYYCVPTTITLLALTFFVLKYIDFSSKILIYFTGMFFGLVCGVVFNILPEALLNQYFFQQLYTQISRSIIELVAGLLYFSIVLGGWLQGLIYCFLLKIIKE
ncbi:hypothetical protein, partial [Zooshikella harenae]